MSRPEQLLGAERVKKPFVPIMPQYQIDYHQRLLASHTIRRDLFVNVAKGVDPEKAKADYLEKGAKLWEDPERLYRRDIRVATFAERGYTIKFGKDGIDTVEPFRFTLDDLVRLEEKDMATAERVLTTQEELKKLQEERRRQWTDRTR